LLVREVRRRLRRRWSRRSRRQRRRRARLDLEVLARERLAREGTLRAGHRELHRARAVEQVGSVPKDHCDVRAEAREEMKEKTVGPFERVWSIVKRVPRGRVVTYGQLSEMIDRRLTPVGVGWAIRAAPDGSIPWHRVVNATGGISTDRANPGVQRAMLESEGVAFDAEGRVDLERAGWKPRSTSPPTSRRRGGGGRSPRK